MVKHSSVLNNVIFKIKKAYKVWFIFFQHNFSSQPQKNSIFVLPSYRVDLK